MGGCRFRLPPVSHSRYPAPHLWGGPVDETVLATLIESSYRQMQETHGDMRV